MPFLFDRIGIEFYYEFISPDFLSLGKQFVNDLFNQTIVMLIDLF